MRQGGSCKRPSNLSEGGNDTTGSVRRKNRKRPDKNSSIRENRSLSIRSPTIAWVKLQGVGNGEKAAQKRLRASLRSVMTNWRDSPIVALRRGAKGRNKQILKHIVEHVKRARKRRLSPIRLVLCTSRGK